MQIKKHGHIVPSILLVMCFHGHVQAADISTSDLKTQLQQRDQVILELLERVEALEKELNIKPMRKPLADPAQTSKPDSSVSLTTTADDRPGVVVADEQMAERALERSLTRDGVLLLPSGVLEFEPRLTYARQEDTAPGFVTSNMDVLASETERNSDSFTANLLFRLGLPGDAQFELGIPYRWRHVETVSNVNFSPVQTSSQSGQGVGDLRLTFAKTLLHEDARYPDLIARLTWDTDSGEVSDDGVPLGGGFHELQASLSYIKREDPVVFVGGLAYEYTFEANSIQPGESIAANVGTYIALSPQTSLNLALSLAYEGEVEIAGEAIPGSDRTFASLILGGSTFIGRGTLLNFSLGIGLTDDADDFSVSISLPVRLENTLF